MNGSDEARIPAHFLSKSLACLGTAYACSAMRRLGGILRDHLTGVGAECSVHEASLSEFMTVVGDAVLHSVVFPLGDAALSDLLENLYLGEAITPPILMRLNDGRLRIVDGGGTILALQNLANGSAGSVMFDPVNERFFPYGHGDSLFAMHAAEVFTASPANLGKIIGARNCGVLSSGVTASIEKLRSISTRSISYIELRQTEAIDRIQGMWVRFRSSGSRLSMARVSFLLDGVNKNGTRQYRRLHCEIVPPHHSWFRLAA